MREKKIVFYTEVSPKGVKVGTRVMVVPTNHSSPLVTNHRPALTTPVEWIDEITGIFETRNSIYKPCF